MSKVKIIQIAVLIIFCAVFIWQAVSYSFTQDDAFISFRYVRNFLDGNGLVFNTGEKVEGYTNLFFIIMMSLLGRFGLDIVVASKVIGVISGTAIIILSFSWIRRMSDVPNETIIPLTIPFLLITNGSFAYWTISGMETTLFSVMILYGLYLAANKNMLYLPVLAVATLTRPEGALVFLIALIFHFYYKNLRLINTLRHMILFAVLIIPQIIFRLAYYNDILPNPFYAKTGWSLEYLKSGLEYLWLFCRQYGLYGGLFLIPIWASKYFSQSLRLIFTSTIVYTLYIVLIGGDVLHCQRFFIPIVPLLYMLLLLSMIHLFHNLTIFRIIDYKQPLIAIIILFGIFSFASPRAGIDAFLIAERGLVNKMTNIAFILRQHGSQEKLIACSTVGALGYFGNAHIIDMLGLTDRNIAKSPQAFRQIRSTWKERNYNIPYIMEQNPDYIIFSTGQKPSAPAEKALFLSSKFRQGYYPVFDDTGGRKVFFKKRSDYAGKDNYFTNPIFIDLYAEAINHEIREEYDQAFSFALQSTMQGPADFYLPLSILGRIQLEFGEPADGITFLREALKRSGGYATFASEYLAKYYEAIGDTSAAEELYRSLLRINRLD
jgi:arabinofuranosyltransferase